MWSIEIAANARCVCALTINWNVEFNFYPTTPFEANENADVIEIKADQNGRSDQKYLK